jgi:hypothetical protein
MSDRADWTYLDVWTPRHRWTYWCLSPVVTVLGKDTVGLGTKDVRPSGLDLSWRLDAMTSADKLVATDVIL